MCSSILQGLSDNENVFRNKIQEPLQWPPYRFSENNGDTRMIRRTKQEQQEEGYKSFEPSYSWYRYFAVVPNVST